MADPSTFERYRSVIADWDEFAEAINRPLPVCIWANPLKTTSSELEELLSKNDIDAEPLSWRDGAYRLVDTARPGSRIPFLAGLYQIQEEVSMLPVELLDLRAGQRVLDTCAAPGSKTSQIAATLGNTGTIIANDRNFRRMRALSRSLDRLGATNVGVMTRDATNMPGAIGSFDRILADVPCSCEGTTRKNRDATVATDDDFNYLCTIQRAILKRAIELCRPGGRVVYSTCTYAPEENETIVDSVLREFYDECRLIPARIPGFPASPGLLHWQQQSYDPQLEHALRVYPHQHDTGGFFVAVFQKTRS